MQPEKTPPAEHDVRVPLYEEKVTVATEEVVTGRVRVSTRVETFEETARAVLQSEEVDVTRVPIGRTVEGRVPQVTQRGDVTVVPILEEVIVVEKKLVLKEELHIRKRTTADTVEMPVTLRRQVADVERSSE